MLMYREDRKPDLVLTITDNGVPVDLTGATSIRLIAVRDFTTTVIDAAVSGDASGVITYLWAAADTETVGSLVVEVEITWPGGLKQTIRAAERVTIVEGLG